uniref:Uncharacterized protein n=1 Tax=Chromera velia CCMP2878 TaxID=1169474 RepID=A0A0G4H7D5_9ALVE|mmetsp:Transcript_48498/g.95680  ORF Transcript_48498/g.95680 Transcript_48498/m.95680 type:complete len:114 (-) Transcript_48498:122-463(-)|eukprot:Cvel_24936.t1-p1 / transcript=Cvel_24936.t1 / gene=Cvel_24936 / organism=Chromera_velia_CCMP2878 / gene_product=hypothetical protein / transcript_product=hypothetical protein / location=Cvel_scaffold2759:12195-12533(-) / protein_length=113 / sequence_SO=supercontig / SO=protein_coding / is_pseudo=false
MKEDAEKNAEEGQGLLAASAAADGDVQGKGGKLHSLKDSESDPPFRIFAYTVAFIGLVSFWGLLDTLVEYAAKKDIMVRACIYATLSVVCLVVLKIYQLYDTKYDPTRHLSNA